MNCVQWFRKTYPDVLAFHVPNGEWRHRHTADTLQRMGVKAGVWDWLFFSAKRSCMVAIEFKADKGSLTDDQKVFESAWEALGGTAAVIRTLEDFQTLCIHSLGEPAPRVVDVTPPPHKMPWET